MSSSDNCPICDNIYGNEPRKIPCGHIVCHKCCLEFNNEENTLECPTCYKVHTFKSKNIFKKTLQQVAHANFGKKTTVCEVSFASTMPVENASGGKKSANKEVKKAVVNLPTAPPGAPPETSLVPPPPPPPPPEPVVAKSPLAMPLMPTRPAVIDAISRLAKEKQGTPNNIAPPSLFNTIVSPSSVLSASDAVIARCHSCGTKCQVIVCVHCDHFICLKCAEEHRTTTKIDTQNITNKWQECQNKYNILIQKINRYNHDRTQIENDLAAIRVAIEQRTRDAIQYIIDQRDSLIGRIDEHMEYEQTINSIKHNELANEFRRIQNRFDSALNGEDIGSYTHDDFFGDIRELQTRMNKRNDLIETHILQIPTITRYERVRIEKLLGELQFHPHMTNSIPNPSISTPLNNSYSSKQNDFLEYPSIFSTTRISNSSPKMSSDTSSSSINTITPPSNYVLSTNDITTVKPLTTDTYSNGTIDAFNEFRRMAAQIHQKFNAPYSKIIDAASSPARSPPIPTTDEIQTNGESEKNTRALLTIAQNKMFPTDTFTKSWKVEHTSVPKFLCMTPYPTPKIFVVDKYGKVSVCSIPPNQIKPYQSYTLFPNSIDEWIESVVATSHFLIVYSRKKQDTMTGTMYFFNHECKPVLPNGIHQNIPVHHILCDQNANRLYCLDRMRCTIYYHTLPNRVSEIETCMKTRQDFIKFNSSYKAVKMFQNDDILGFYEGNDCTVHLYDKQKAEKIEEFKCEHFIDKFESWGIIAIRKDNNSLIFKVDERVYHDAVTREYIVYEVNRSTKQVISKIQLNSVFGMIIGPNNEVILSMRQGKESGLVQCYVRK
jgi:hypothetical protein